MQLKIENILGHGYFEANFNPGVTVVTGGNASGKTSLMLCLAALAAHDGNPARISGTAKKNYIRDGSKTGEAWMEDRLWEPGQEVATPIDAKPLACPEAVGIYDFARTRPKAERSLPYAKLEGEAKSPEDMLRGTWPHNAIKLEAVCGTIDRTGWDKAHAVFTEQLRDAKRKWSDVTGAGTYGVNKAAKWLPEGWSADIVGMGEQRARKIESDARDNLHGLETAEAVATDRRVRRDAAQERIPDLEEKLLAIADQLQAVKERQLSVDNDDVKKTFDEAEAKWREVKNEQSGQPKEIGKCPDCGSVLTRGKSGKLVNTAKFKVAPDIDERVKKASEEYEAATKELQRANGEIRAQQHRLDQIFKSQSFAEAELAQSRRDAALDEGEVIYPDEVEQARDDLAEASENVRIVTQMVAAAKAASAVAELAIVVAKLAPSGVRAGGMGGVMDRVNNGLAKIRKITGWGAVKVEKDFTITYDGRPPELIAASERARINYAMAAVFALMTKSRVLTFEGIDILSVGPLGGLFNLVRALNGQDSDMRIVLDGTDIEKKVPQVLEASIISVD